MRTTTDRGFAIIKFEDRYGAPCSLQMSSLASEQAVWLGVDDARARILATDAAANGVETDADCGWVSYPIPEAVLLNTRMHLTREQVAELIPVLQRFVADGEI